MLRLKASSYLNATLDQEVLCRKYTMATALQFVQLPAGLDFMYTQSSSAGGLTVDGPINLSKPIAESCFVLFALVCMPQVSLMFLLLSTAGGVRLRGNWWSRLMS
jgi:hypothetical protein